MRRILITTIALFCMSTSAAAEQSGSRMVHFPEGRAVGRLMIRDANFGQPFTTVFVWDVLCQAQGDATVPAGKELKLEVYRDETDISFLAELGPNDLQGLSLRRTALFDEDFVHLKDLTGLLALDISSMEQIDGSGLAHLVNLQALKELSCFNSTVSDPALEHISQLHSLEQLTLYLTEIDGSGLNHLRNLTSLKALSLSKTAITDASLVHLKDMTWLEELELYGTRIGNDGLAHLKGLTSLERLILGTFDSKSDPSPITDEGLAYLSKLTNLKEIGLSRTQVTNAGLRHLSGLTKLESLNLNETKITGKGFGFLNEVSPLRGLELDKIDLTDAGVANLKPWSATLEHLVLDGAKLTDADLRGLADLTALKYINFSNTEITDEGLIHIGRLKSLDALRFDNTKITDEGLMTLKDLPRLRSIALTGTLVTRIGLEDFRQASASRSIEANVRIHFMVTKERGATPVESSSPMPEAQLIPLIGKPVPNFDGIQTDFSFEQADGSRLLLCFFDMEQRPSRSCIMRLAKQAERLKQKGLLVIAIQASTIDEKTLGEWIEKYNIPLPVGMVRGDAEKARFTWGVKSLPWLILTDSHHVVSDEGFGLSELDEKIKAVE